MGLTWTGNPRIFETLSSFFHFSRKICGDDALDMVYDIYVRLPLSFYYPLKTSEQEGCLLWKDRLIS
jgi:hypothetical protein